jgi:hypothetical protein
VCDIDLTPELINAPSFVQTFVGQLYINPNEPFEKGFYSFLINIGGETTRFFITVKCEVLELQVEYENELLEK